MALREALIRTVASTRPSLFYYKARAEQRRGIRVVETDRTLDIVRERERQIVRISRDNYIYIVDMIESFEYYFTSAEPVLIRYEGEPYSLIDFSTPRLHRIAGFDDFPVLSPSLTEPFETIRQYLDFAELTAGATVLDLGAYSGLTSIAFAKAVGPQGRVVALEPDPLTFIAARTNIASNTKVNGLDNITLVPAAVAGQPGILKFSSEGAMGSSLTSIVGTHRGKSVDVECVTLAGLAERNGLERVDFIKMDVEGAELGAILESGTFLQTFRPRMIIEPHVVDGQLTSDAIIPFLTGLGYECEVIEQTGVALPLVTAR